MDERSSLLTEVKRLVEQEGVWDNIFYASPVEKPSDLNNLSPRKDATRGPIAEENRPVAASPITVAPATSGSKEQRLQVVYERYKDCVRCPLGTTRIKLVFGVGNPEAKVLFIGEGPGYEEDRRGEPFVGKAGQLLDKIMAAIGLDRTNSYIANIVKCHPMQNPETPEARGNDRAPNGLEVDACSPILRQQIAAIQPAFIVTLGAPSTRTLLQTTEGITKLRGRLFPFPVDAFYPPADPLTTDPEHHVTLDEATRRVLQSTKVLPTYHPAALLRNPDLKKDVWTDMKLLRDSLQQSIF